jgi:hypothetical protein
MREQRPRGEWHASVTWTKNKNTPGSTFAINLTTCDDSINSCHFLNSAPSLTTAPHRPKKKEKNNQYELIKAWKIIYFLLLLVRDD